MQIRAITCPSCGFPPAQSSQFVDNAINSCAHCGTTFSIQFADQVIRTTIHTHDEARIELAKIEREKWERAKEVQAKQEAERAEQARAAKELAAEQAAARSKEDAADNVMGCAFVSLVFFGIFWYMFGIFPALINTLILAVTCNLVGEKAKVGVTLGYLVGGIILHVNGLTYQAEVLVKANPWWWPDDHAVMTFTNWTGLLYSMLGAGIAGTLGYLMGAKGITEFFDELGKSANNN